MLAEKKLDYQFDLEDVWNAETILKANPLGKVPAWCWKAARRCSIRA